MRGRGRIVVAMGVVLAAAVAGISWSLLRDGGGGVAGEPLIPHVNRFGGYRFGYPEEWAIDDAGTTSKVTSPDRAIVITFGFGPDGSLRGAAERFADSVLDTYDESSLLKAERQRVGGRRAVLASGIGTNETGVRIRFLVVVVKGPDRNYGISVFTAASSDPAVVVPTANRILDSFRVLPTA